VKRLWLVAESLPLKEDGNLRKALKSANLPETLVPLDPRHGVFPNLVMKPLFAAGYSLSQNHSEQLPNFFREMNDVVSDQSVRRFNVFENRATKSKTQRKKKMLNERPMTDIFEISNARLSERIRSFNVQEDLWLVFGHQTNFGLLWWLLEGEDVHRTEKARIKDFSARFVTAVGVVSPPHRCGTNGQLSGRIGLFHRLCTGADTEKILEDAVRTLGPKSSYSTEQISQLLRATVPLLHNEGYQDGSNPTGNAQSHFVRYAKGKVAEGDLYWQVMGNAIAARILGSFVE
jgi:hypothetical protein